MSLEAIKFDRADKTNYSVFILDQTLLPYVNKYLPVDTIEDGYNLIKSMKVRGAPAIAISGVLSVLMECQKLSKKYNAGEKGDCDLSNYDSFKQIMLSRLDFLLRSRPTAVNLQNAINEVVALLNEPYCGSFDEFHQKLYDYACKLLDGDLENNKRMGDHGASFLQESLSSEGFEGEFGVLTICNTGSLATSGHGTALGVIRSLWKMSQEKPTKPRMVHVFPLETRPYNQGSRLTAYELRHDGIPSTLITDSSVAYKISTSPVPIKAAFVGADRIVANGDTANKIGTFQLAILCKHFGIKFYVVAPKYTVDLATATGGDIFVEERPADEFRLVTGTSVDSDTAKPVLDQEGAPVISKVGITPPDMPVWNPSFDVTPHEFIDGIILEDGVLLKDGDGKFDLSQITNSR
ncbi:HDL044Wp [Eremothecium sinecaudum]|uniref:Methylthioribose-1-phosphate isomerase n=1 Tax=Eremothecium sinecaudum TaxID=45286 RepID=A0A120K280_9SACH|nr:HDL044Wp [Eremothecium sinecaudum]AMD20700.1 HDL044Wp [Eremothecium sinecaudum]